MTAPDSPPDQRLPGGTPDLNDLLDADGISQRLTELEIKASFTEDLLDQLDKVIVRQQQQIDALVREVAELKAAPAQAGGIHTARSLRDDLPPHF